MPRKPKAAAAPARRPSRARASVAEALVPFAHLMDPVPQASAPAPARAKGRRAEDEERREESEDEEDEDKRARGRRASDEDEEGDDEDREKAEDGDDEEGDEEDDKRARSRRTAAEEDEDAEDDDEEQDEKDDRDPKARAARSRERARCARILGSKAAAGRAAAAANLACNTTMSAKAAVKLLGTLPKQQAAAPGLGQRMADLGNRPSAAETPAPSRKQQAAASWDTAMKRAGVTPRG
ncbi:hypothetical protein VQH23_21035 [Pararoseomonas sp. SCSIO 73927]|uniref:hypothetical protein n=1 Tax=Pararoseomonas sp. SCSIO 73927 TaxID=3114537 RepID=UPI0030CC8C25